MAKGTKSKGGAVGQALVKRSGASKGGKGGRAGGKGSAPANDTLQPDGAQRPLVSVVEQSDLQELLQAAELAGRDFAGQRGEPTLVFSGESDIPAPVGMVPESKIILRRRRAEQQAQAHQLSVPRRPHWTAGMTAQELDAREKASFLEWRRKLAGFEQNELLKLTPFEKNLDIWRQLWRVLERSHVVVTVVDSRNPLFYKCPDLEVYVKEMDSRKSSLLLLNKADLLPLEVRHHWAEYFAAKGIDFAFWSAMGASEAAGINSQIPVHQKQKQAPHATHVHSRDELLALLEAKAKAVRDAGLNLYRSKHHALTGEEGSQGGSEDDVIETPVVVGFVGYPNVGKSSTINALVGAKKTGVTSTPGKTKHFQTLTISPTLTLCDCPGLVFPSFVSSRSEMVAAGVLPIDRITDERGPVEVVCQRVARRDLESIYGITLPKPAAHEDPRRPPTAQELIRTYAVARGQMGHAGLPLETRVARQILRDFLSGKLPHFRLPPSEDGGEEDFEESTEAAQGARTRQQGRDDSAGCSDHTAEDGEDAESEGSEWEEVEDGGSGEEDDSQAEGSTEGEQGRNTAEGEDEDRGGVSREVAVGERDVGKEASSLSTSEGARLFGSDGVWSSGLPSHLRVKVQPPSATASAAASGMPLGALDLDEDLEEFAEKSDATKDTGRVRTKAPHKMHKKVPRKKDRSWRVNKEGEGPYRI